MPYGKRKYTRKAATAVGRPRRAKRHVYRGRGRKRAAGGSAAVPATASVPSPFGKNYFTRLVYQDLLEINAVGGVVAQLSYRINDCFDPYSGIGGHQPRFFDAFCGPNGGGAPYDQFRVFAALVEFTCLNTDVTGDWSQMFIHWRTGQASTIVDIVDMGEAPNTLSCSMAGGNSPSGARKLTKYIKMAPMLGVKDLRDDEASIGDVNNSPTSLVLMDVGFSPMQLVNATMLATIQITFYVQFMDQVYPTVS